MLIGCKGQRGGDGHWLEQVVHPLGMVDGVDGKVGCLDGPGEFLS